MSGEFWIIVIVVYFLPSIAVLVRRRANSAAIFALNLFLGWTGIGWVVSLVWALMDHPESHQGSGEH